jgi:hypothetical protein
MMIRQTSFEGKQVLHPSNLPSRPKGWRFINTSTFTAEVGKAGVIGKMSVDQHLNFRYQRQDLPGTGGIVGQEVRSPFPGIYRLYAQVIAEAANELDRKELLEKYSFHLLFFQFTDPAKQIDKRKSIGEVEFVPEFANADSSVAQLVEMTKPFMSAGGNFSFGLWMGVGIEIRQKNATEEPWLTDAVEIHVLTLDLEFLGKERDPDITV